MTRPRSSQISLNDTPWYHIVSRCVRRAFLCGDDAHSGANFDHRRQWIVEWIMRLAAIFSIAKHKDSRFVLTFQSPKAMLSPILPTRGTLP